MFQEVLHEISRFNRIILHRHTKPDGDALGSQIGLKHIIRENFPEKEVYAVGDGAGFYGFMDDSAMDTIPDEAYTGALAVILDCGGEGLVSDKRYCLARRTVRMDHHLYTGSFTDVEAVDASYESCCGLVAAFAMECGLRLTPAAAKALYTGMVTDSGRFRFDTTTARTFRLAAFLMEQPFDTKDIYRDLYSDTYENKKRKAQFLLNVRFTPANVAYVYTTLEQFHGMNMDAFSVSRGMVNTMADIKGVDIWANFTETEQGVLCELRSARPNINPIAVKYGGGGHAKASGATLPDYETAMAMLRDLDQLMGE